MLQPSFALEKTKSCWNQLFIYLKLFAIYEKICLQGTLMPISIAYKILVVNEACCFYNFTFIISGYSF